MVEQGDIIKIEGIDSLALVISKNTYNHSEKAIVCPVINKSRESTFEIEFEIDNKKKYVVCDNVKQLDLKSRFYSNKGRISLSKLIQVVDLLEAIIDYY